MAFKPVPSPPGASILVTGTTDHPAAQMLIVGPQLGLSTPCDTPHLGCDPRASVLPPPHHPHIIRSHLDNLAPSQLLSSPPLMRPNPLPAARVGLQKVIVPLSAFIRPLLVCLWKTYCVPATVLCWGNLGLRLI